MSNENQLDMFDGIDMDEIVSTTDVTYIPASIREVPKPQPKKEKQMKRTVNTIDSAVKQRMIKKAIEQAVSILTAIDAKFVISTNDGGLIKRGEWNAGTKPTIRKTGDDRRPNGAFADRYKPYLKDLAVGDVAEVPCGGFEHAGLQGAMTAWMSTTWGKGSYASSYNAENDTLEVIRYK